MPKASEIAGYTVLPLQLPATPLFPTPAIHFLYLRPHEPRIPDPDAPRSLFLVNIPVDTTETHLRNLFSTRLSAGRVERVKFEDAKGPQSQELEQQQRQDAQSASDQTARGKKRKRSAPSSTDLERQLDTIRLPTTWDRKLHRSGRHAVVVFVDRAAMELSLKAARKMSAKWSKAEGKGGNSAALAVPWELAESTAAPPPQLGIKRYRAHLQARYPPRDELLALANEYMSIFTAAEEARAREAAMRAQQVDEDGFITVTRGPKLSGPAAVAREEEIKELIEKQKKQQEGKPDFYRFQMREARKERVNELRKKFSEDLKRVQEMRTRKAVCFTFSLLFFPLLLGVMLIMDSRNNCSMSGKTTKKKDSSPVWINIA